MEMRRLLGALLTTSIPCGVIVHADTGFPYEFGRDEDLIRLEKTHKPKMRSLKRMQEDVLERQPVVEEQNLAESMERGVTKPLANWFRSSIQKIKDTKASAKKKASYYLWDMKVNARQGYDHGLMGGYALTKPTLAVQMAVLAACKGILSLESPVQAIRDILATSTATIPGTLTYGPAVCVGAACGAFAKLVAH